MKTALLRFRGAALRHVAVSIDGGTGVPYEVGDFVVLGSSGVLVFNNRTVVRVRGIAAGGHGYSVGFVHFAGGGGGQGARNDVGVLVTIAPGSTYAAAVGNAGAGPDAGRTRFSLGGDIYLDLTGGATGNTFGSAGGAGGAGGVVLVGAGGINGESGASGFGAGSPAKGADRTYGGASGGASNNGGAGGDGGDTPAGLGQPGASVPGSFAGGGGRNGAGIIITGDSVPAGYGGGGQGEGNSSGGGVIGGSLYTAATGPGRMTLEIVSIG